MADTKDVKMYYVESDIEKIQTKTSNMSKGSSPWLNGIYPRDTRIFQYLKVNLYDITC